MINLLQALEEVQDFVYLGSQISKDGCTSEIARRISLGWIAFSKLKRLIWNRNELSVQTKVRLFKVLVLSRVLYAAETWSIKEGDMKTLEAFQTKCLRKILQISWEDHVTNQVIREKALVPTLESTITQRRLKWSYCPNAGKFPGKIIAVGQI